jgi:hypothetical protein
MFLGICQGLAIQLWNLLASFQHSCNVDLRLPNEMRTATYIMLTAYCLPCVQNLDSLNVGHNIGTKQ